MTIPEALRQASEALQQASAALTTVAQAMEDAPGPEPTPAPEPSVAASQEVEPQPDAFPEPGTPRTGGWIVDRVPDAKDSSDEARGLVRIPQRPGTPQRPPGDPLLTCHWSAVQLGQPWAPIGYRVDPWDPTCLDRNGWIRSRLPTVEDAKGVGVVLIPVGHGGTTSTIAYHLIVPGQPWAPWGSNPGGLEK